MVLELAVNSVEKKLNMKASIIVGNYEYYYSCGKLAALTSLAADENTEPMAMKEAVTTAIASFDAGEDETKQFLIRLLDRYRPSEAYDEQMKELFLMGKGN